MTTPTKPETAPMPRTHRRPARNLLRPPLEVIEARAAVSTIASEALAVVAGAVARPIAPEPVEVRAQAFRPTVADRLAADRKALSPIAPRTEMVSAGAQWAEAPHPTWIPTADESSGVITLDNPDPRRDITRAAHDSPKPANQPQGGAALAKSYGSGGSAPVQAAGTGIAGPQGGVAPTHAETSPAPPMAPAIFTNPGTSSAQSVPATQAGSQSTFSGGNPHGSPYSTSEATIAPNSTLTLTGVDTIFVGTSYKFNRPVAATFGGYTVPNPYPGSIYYNISFNVNWGDGVQNNGIRDYVDIDGYNSILTPYHLYKEDGIYTVTLTAYVNGQSATCKDTVVVGDELDVESVQPIDATAGQPFLGPIASYFDVGNPTLLDDMTAEVDWGDGETSTGMLSCDGSGHYSVAGSHAYARGGTYPVTITILHGNTEETIVGGDSNGIQIDDTATVADAGVLAVYSSTSPEPTPPPPSSAPTVGDAGFEAVRTPTADFVYNPSGSPWVFSGLTGLADNNSGFSNSNPPAPDGTQVAFLQQGGSFSQSVTGWAAGSYTVAFQAAQRANLQAGQQDFQVLVDGTVVGTFTPAGTAYRALTTGSFPVAAGDHTLTFQGLDTAGGDNTALIDTVAIAPVTDGDPPGSTINASDAAPFDGLVARFTDSDPNATPDKYAISVDFGDGEGPEEGYVVADPVVSGVFDVYGYRDFFAAALYAGVATITETGGTLLAMNFAVNVAEASPVAAGSVPTIKITSRGSRPGDGTTTTDVEGMKYTVGQSISMPANNGTNSKQYSYVATNYTYPDTAAKGYGRVKTTPIGTVRFNGDPIASEAATVSAFQAGDQSSSLVTYGSNANFIDSFYWGAAAVGTQTINVTALFNVFVKDAQERYVLQSQQYRATDSVQVNVLRPFGNITVNSLGTPGKGTGSYDGKPRVGIDQDSVIVDGKLIDGPPGIDYTATVGKPTPNDLGKFAVVQIIDTNESFATDYTSKDGVQISATVSHVLPDGSFPPALDTRFPYGKIGTTGGTIRDIDAPGTKLAFPGKPTSFYREDHFDTTLLYKPNDPGIWVPVGTIDWGWDSSVTYIYAPNVNAPTMNILSDRFPTIGNPVYVPASSNDDFPTWDHNVKEFKLKVQ